MTQSAASVPFSQYFNGYIQDGKIYTQSWEGTQQVGVLLSVYAELQEQHNSVLSVTEGYKQRLIELGEIEIPLTQEQIISQQAEQIRQSQELLNRLAAKVEALTKEKKPHGYDQPDRNDSREEPKDEGNDDSGPNRSARNRAKSTRASELHPAE